MSRKRLCSMMVAGALTLISGAAAHGQHNAPQSFPAPIPGPITSSTEDPSVREAQARQVQMRNEDRQKRLVADADKLLRLATELHEEIAKTNKNVLSLEVIKRADEIERLAHSVKERMKQ